MSEQVTTDRPFDLTQEIALPPEVVSGPLPAEVWPKRKLFLTGSTGFLGVHLLAELLEKTSAEIHCLVRCDEGTARSKIESALRTSNLWSDGYRDRLVAVPGNLGEPRLGLSSERFEQLANDVDVVYHNGARVNLADPYAALKKANVLATREILRLATKGHLKPVHYVSTTGILNSAAAEIGEDMAVPHHSGLLSGYQQSKWVADQTVCRAAAYGVPVTIYRPSRIVGHSRSGYANTGDFFYRLTKGITVLSKAPRHAGFDNLLPVDSVSQIIVDASLNRDARGRALNVVNPRWWSFDELIDFLEEEGHPLERLSYSSWLSEVDRYAKDHPEYPLAPLVPVLAFLNPEADPRLSRFPAMATRNMIELASRHTIDAIPSTKNFLRASLDYLYATGYVGRPQRAQA
jgi:thioester reductase-like protein